MKHFHFHFHFIHGGFGNEGKYTKCTAANVQQHEIGAEIERKKKKPWERERHEERKKDQQNKIAQKTLRFTC